MEVTPQNAPSVQQVHQPLTKKECREIVTPYAFIVDENLLGTPLASPMRRAVAMGIDALIIVGLASASLWFILPVMLYLCYLRFRLKKFGQVMLLLLGTLLLSTTAIYAPELITESENNSVSQTNQEELSPGAAAQFAVSALRLNSDDCKLECIKAELLKSSQQLATAGVAKTKAKELLLDMLEATDLPVKARKELVKQQLSDYQPETVVTPVVATEPQAELSKSTAEAQSSTTKAWYQPSEDTQSIIGWVKGILADFGLGFGWAVFYFTAYIHWAHGQTIGKMLCQIKVIQLDGQELDVFAAFSRQGGYGAGFATGFMGFLQVFWDPNRQAIHDKIASTVVIRLNQPKRPLHH